MEEEGVVVEAEEVGNTQAPRQTSYQVFGVAKSVSSITPHMHSQGSLRPRMNWCMGRTKKGNRLRTFLQVAAAIFLLVRSPDHTSLPSSHPFPSF